MSRGRKKIHLETVGTKGNRQRVWEAVREFNGAEFTGYTIARRSGVHDEAVRSYLQGLHKAGYLERVVNQTNRGAFSETPFKLIKDTGADAPALTRSGKPVTTGRGTEAMWRTLRILGDVSAHDLVAHVSASVSITLWTAKTYLKWLKRAGYIVEVQTAQGGKSPARYRLVQGKYSGPRAPMIQRIGQVFDPNLGQVVYVQPQAEVEYE